MKLTILFVFITIACSAQVNDSLLYQLNQIESDTERVNQLYKTGFDLRNIEPESSYEIAMACEKAALKSKSSKHLAKSYNLIGILYYKKGDFSKAMHFQKQSLALNQSVHNETGIAINQTNLGNIYSDINYLQLAEQCYLQALKSYNKTNDKLHITRSLINIGVLKYNQKQFHSAVKQFEQALNYANQIGDYDLIASCYNNIGTILREQGKLDSALIYLEEGLKIRQLTDNELEMADSYNNIANVYIILKNFSQASNYILLADEICKKYNYSEALLELFHTRSLFYEAQEDFKQANSWLKKYVVLNDSLHKVENEIEDPDFLNDPVTIQKAEHETSQTGNPWLLFTLLIMLVGLPLFLIRYKR